MKGSLIISHVTDFFGKYLRNNTLRRYKLIIVSKDIMSNTQVNLDGKLSYQSDYENVVFDNTIIPCAYAEQYAHGLNIPEFLSAYNKQLSTKQSFGTLCAIVDLVVNRDMNVILLTSDIEYNKIGFVEPLRDFIYNNFGLYMGTISEIENDQSILHDYNSEDDIKKKLAYQIVEHEYNDDALGIFINKFDGDMEDKYREILMSKSLDWLYKYGLTKSIHINKYKSKEYAVDQILRTLLGGVS